MEFDKSRVYTSLNADEVKVGSKGYFADNLVALEDLVRNFDPCEAKKLIEVENAKSLYRFKSSVNFHWNLFYLVEEPPKEELCTYRELARWLAQGNGEWIYNGSFDLSFTHRAYEWREPDKPLEVDKYLVRKWSDKEWHAPTKEYMGIK